MESKKLMATTLQLGGKDHLKAPSAVTTQEYPVFLLEHSLIGFIQVTGSTGREHDQNNSDNPTTTLYSILNTSIFKR